MNQDHGGSTVILQPPFRTENDLSHSHDVTGSVAKILSEVSRFLNTQVEL